MPRHHLRNTCPTLSTIVLLLALLLPCQPLPAKESLEPEAEAQARALQHLYAGLTSLTFDFAQITRTGSRERTGQGHAVFYKPAAAATPGKTADQDLPRSVMRWNYAEPDHQVIINDGKTLLIYTEKDKQLIKTPAKELESDITYAFFSGTRNLLDDFEAQAPAEEVLSSRVGAQQTLLLVPRTPHNQIKAVQIWFDERGVIQRLLLTDHFDAETELRFSRIVLNSLPPGDRQQLETIISFQPPPGTEVITR
ncbi:MAG: LolA family protein [Desulfobulbaceae bacterium]